MDSCNVSEANSHVLRQLRLRLLLHLAFERVGRLERDFRLLTVALWWWACARGDRGDGRGGASTRW